MMRILLVAHIPPYPMLKNGGGQRTELVRRGLALCGRTDTLLIHNIDAPHLAGLELRSPDMEVVWAAQPAADARVRGPGRLREWVRNRWVPRMLRPYRPNRRLHRIVQEHATQEKYDLVVVRSHLSAEVIRLHALRGVPRILDADDLDWEKFRLRRQFEQDGGKPGGLADRFWYRHAKRRGLATLRGCKWAWVASEDDRSLVGMEHVSVLPNIPFAPAIAEAWAPCPPPADDSRDLLFVGDLGYTPNRGGMARFLDGVWPKVLAAVPEARLVVVSSRISDDIGAHLRAAPSVQILGFVEDLRAPYERSAFTVAPVYWGGGTKIKVLESLAYGRTCVGDRHAFYGFAGLAHGRTHWSAATDEEFADGCVRLLHEPAMNRDMAARGCEVTMGKYSFTAFAAEVRRTVEKARGTCDGCG